MEHQIEYLTIRALFFSGIVTILRGTLLSRAQYLQWERETVILSSLKACVNISHAHMQWVTVSVSSKESCFVS